VFEKFRSRNHFAALVGADSVRLSFSAKQAGFRSGVLGCFPAGAILRTPLFLPRFQTFLKNLSFVCFAGNEAEFLFTLGLWSRIPEIVDVYLDLLSCVGRRIPDDVAARFRPGLLFLLRKNLPEFFPRIVAALCEFPTFDPTILGFLNLTQADLVAVLNYRARRSRCGLSCWGVRFQTFRQLISCGGRGDISGCSFLLSRGLRKMPRR
jgi:hypothetical protein